MNEYNAWERLREEKNEMQNRTAFWMWADKRHFELSSTLAVFYYAINDHALLKSCIYFVSVSLFMFSVPFFMVKIITDFARWPFRHFFLSLYRCFFCVLFQWILFSPFWDYLFGQLVRVDEKKTGIPKRCRITFRITNVVESFKWNQ